MAVISNIFNLLFILPNNFSLRSCIFALETKHFKNYEKHIFNQNCQINSVVSSYKF